MCNYFLVTLKFIIFDLIMSKIEKLLENLKAIQRISLGMNL